MAARTPNSVVSTGTTPTAAAQLSAWASADTISESIIGSRGVVAIIANSSGGSLDCRVGDPGLTPAGNAAANAYTTITVADGATKWIYIGPTNVDKTLGYAKVGASVTNAGFTIQLLQY